MVLSVVVVPVGRRLGILRGMRVLVVGPLMCVLVGVRWMGRVVSTIGWWSLVLVVARRVRRRRGIRCGSVVVVMVVCIRMVLVLRAVLMPVRPVVVLLVVLARGLPVVPVVAVIGPKP